MFSFAMVEKNRAHLGAFLPWVEKAKTVEDTGAFRNAAAKKWAETGTPTCGIFYKEAFCGMVDIHDIDTANNKSSIGYWLSKDHNGKGIMIQAVIAMLDHAFNDLKLNYMFIRAAEHNVKSRDIPERLGFTLEGTLRAHEKHGDTYFDMCHYGMTAKEWSERELA